MLVCLSVTMFSNVCLCDEHIILYIWERREADQTLKPDVKSPNMVEMWQTNLG